MAIVKIPETSNPFRVIVNGVEYAYEAGASAEVPDEVAAVIEQHKNAAENLVTPPPENMGSGSSGTALGGADWNAKEGQPGHVLNRTHWVEISESAVLVPDTAISFTDGPQVMLTEPVVELVEGKEYTVTWNSVEYKCKPVFTDMDGIDVAILGDAAALDDQVDTGEPFVMLAIPPDMVATVGAAMMIMTLVEVYDVTFSIVGYGEIVHKLNKKFLPDMGSSGNAAMIVNLSIGDSGYAADKSYDEIRAHIEAGGLAFVKFSYSGTTAMYQITEVTDGELVFRCLSIDALILRIGTITIDSTNKVSLSSHHINIDAVD